MSTTRPSKKRAEAYHAQWLALAEKNKEASQVTVLLEPPSIHVDDSTLATLSARGGDNEDDNDDGDDEDDSDEDEANGGKPSIRGDTGRQPGAVDEELSDEGEEERGEEEGEAKGPSRLPCISDQDMDTWLDRVGTIPMK